MKIEDMKVGALVKCTKPEWDCYGDIFEITKFRIHMKNGR